MASKSKIEERYKEMEALVITLSEMQKFEEDYDELTRKERSTLEDMIGLAEMLNEKAHEVCVKYSDQYRKVRGL